MGLHPLDTRLLIGGGVAGGRIVAAGTPEEVAADPASSTGRYLRAHLREGLRH